MEDFPPIVSMQQSTDHLASRHSADTVPHTTPERDDRWTVSTLIIAVLSILVFYMQQHAMFIPKTYHKNALFLETFLYTWILIGRKCGTP